MLEVKGSHRTAHKLFSADVEMQDHEQRDNFTFKKWKASFDLRLLLMKYPRAKGRVFELALQKQNKIKCLHVLLISNSLVGRKRNFNLPFYYEVALS